MSMKHTPEPWKTSQWESEETGEVHIHVESERKPGLGSDARSIATMTGTYYTRRSNPERQSEINTNVANAARIASCVNACAGIPTEALESGVVAEMRKALEDCITNPRATCIVQNDVAYMIRRFKAINAIAEAVLAKLTPQ